MALTGPERHVRAGLAGLAFALIGAAASASPAPGQDAAQRSYDSGDFAAARQAWQSAAEAGDGQAAFRLGLMHDLGQGVASDAAAAFGWYRRAALAGVPQAEFNVAVMYDGGRGAPHDAGRAALWYSRAAAHGLARAQYDLAQLYAAGEGVPRNPDEAAAWRTAAGAPAAAHGLSRRGPAPATDAPLVPPADAAPAGAPSEADEPGSPITPIELVWAAPAEPRPVRYFATVLARRDTGWVPVLGRYTDVSALLMPALPGVTCYAWRVYAVGLDGSHYAPGAWHTAGCAPPD